MSQHAKHAAPKQKKARAVRTPEAQPEWTRDSENVRPANTGTKGPKKAVVIAIVAAAVLLILMELAYLAFGHFYSKLNYSTAMSESDRAAAIAAAIQQDVLAPEPEEDGDAEEGAESATDDEVDEMQALIQSQLAASGGSLISDKDVINILLIGTDARSRNENARSDVMMLVSANKKTHKIVLTSFMRDIYTYIPGYGYNRLNAPNAIAGPDYLIETLEADFGIDINNYASVNFYAFADIIDELGGIDLSLTSSEVDFINRQTYDGEQAQLGVGTGASWLDYSADGNYHLNGTQALAHCRNRDSAGSDYDRTDRQRTVISALIAKAKSASLGDLYSLANVVLPMVTTDLTQGDCLSLLLKSADYLSYDVESVRIPAVDYYGTMISGMSVISIDFASNAAYLQDIIYN